MFSVCPPSAVRRDTSTWGKGGGVAGVWKPLAADEVKQQGFLPFAESSSSVDLAPPSYRPHAPLERGVSDSGVGKLCPESPRKAQSSPSSVGII